MNALRAMADPSVSQLVRVLGCVIATVFPMLSANAGVCDVAWDGDKIVSGITGPILFTCTAKRPETANYRSSRNLAYVNAGGKVFVFMNERLMSQRCGMSGMTSEKIVCWCCLIAFKSSIQLVRRD